MSSNSSSELLELLKLKVLDEYEQFETEMLNKAKIEIYHSCLKITFWSSLKEFFEYNDAIDSVIINGLIDEPCILEALWQTYLKYEELQIINWTYTESLVRTFIENKING